MEFEHISKNAVQSASPINWVGGKARLAPYIIKLLPDHHTYLEPFCGAAHVLFNKPKSYIEIINDINGELINFYRVLINDPEWLCEKIYWHLYSRELFEEYKTQDVEKLDERARALRFLYILKCCFGSKFGKTGEKVHFGVFVANSQRSRSLLKHMPGRLLQAHERLRNVQVENMDYREFIRRYDRPCSLFFIDPPYDGAFDCYGKGLFGRDDFEILAGLLKNIRGKFLMTVNAAPAVLEAFKDFNCIENMEYHTLAYSINKQQGINKAVPCLLISNYELKAKDEPHLKLQA